MKITFAVALLAPEVTTFAHVRELHSHTLRTSHVANIMDFLLQVTCLGATVQSVLRNERLCALDRDLHVGDVWCGKAELFKAASRVGMQCSKVDVAHDGLECDLRTPRGFNNLCGLLMRLREQGLCWCQPPCDSFVVSTTKNTGRTSRNPSGNISYPAVRDGNRAGDLCCFIFALGACRGFWCGLEHPLASFLFKVPCVVAIRAALMDLNMWHTCATAACCFSPRPDGDRTNKPLKLVATGDWILGMAAKCVCLRGHMCCMLCNSSGGWIPNANIMSSSAAYHKKFASRSVRLWLDRSHLEPVVAPTAKALAQVLRKRPASSTILDLSEPAPAPAPAAPFKKPATATKLVAHDDADDDDGDITYDASFESPVLDDHKWNGAVVLDDD